MATIDQDEVIQILKIISESNFDELHLEMGDFKLLLKKHGSSEAVRGKVRTMEAVAEPEKAFQEPLSTPVTSDVTEPEEIAAPVSESDMQKTEAVVGGHEDGLTPIKAPMLGTFYKAPKPGAPPFVEEGKVVTEDDTVCIIEVMKLFNTVKAGISGRIKKVCVKDAEMVEFGQTLFLVDEAPDEEGGEETHA